jgi:hypothetical protein
MKGIVEIDIATGAVSSKLSSQGEGASVEELTNEQLAQIGTNLTNILQEINSFARENGGDSQLGQFQRMTLKLDEHHFVSIGMGDGKIQAVVEEANKK